MNSNPFYLSATRIKLNSFHLSKVKRETQTMREIQQGYCTTLIPTTSTTLLIKGFQRLRERIMDNIPYILPVNSHSKCNLKEH
jgi:hypothetical protein